MGGSKTILNLNRRDHPNLKFSDKPNYNIYLKFLLSPIRYIRYYTKLNNLKGGISCHWF